MVNPEPLDPTYNVMVQTIKREVADAIAGGGGGGLESRIAKLEAKAESTDQRLSLIEIDLRGIASKIDRNFIVTWGGIIGLALLTLSAFVWMNEKFTPLLQLLSLLKSGQ